MDYPIYASGYGDYSGSYGGGDDGYSPVILDLTGNGINITQLSSSSTFFNTAGNGTQHLTAWAGAGNGVLFYDPTGTGQLTQADQIDFTDWDPSATSDMQALLDVFDTNHDGALDAGDASFADFYVMETNANGTQTAVSLASLGIAAVNLTANTVNIDLPDGSSIDGEATYTTSGGGTGTAATVTFATDANGYAVTTADTANADGSETIAHVAENADGSIAYQNILNTSITSSASGGTTTTTTNKTLSDLNSAGVVLTIQTDDSVETSNASGSTTTETLTDYQGGQVSSSGELTGSGITNSEKLDATTTTTAVNSSGTTLTIARDQLGGGWTSQQEVDSYNTSGALTSITVSQLNPNGSASLVTSTSDTTSGGDSTRTVTSEVDGNSAYATSTTDAITGTAPNITESVTDKAGTTTTSLVTAVTATAANTVTRTTTSDLTDGTTLNLTSVDQTVTSSANSTETVTDKSANNSLLDETVTVNTPQSGGGLVTTVTSSELDGYGSFIETSADTATISSAGATSTTTVVDDSADGTQLSKTITTSTVGSAVGSVTDYANGDGDVTSTQSVTLSGGTTTGLWEDLNGDGSLTDATETVTASGGTSKTIFTDATGAGTASAPTYDYETTDVTTTSGGASFDAVTEYGASTSDEIDQTDTVTSANGLTISTFEDFTGANFVADGSWDQIITDQTTVNSDGSLTETITVTDGAAHVLETTTKQTSANRESLTTTTTLGTTGLVKTVETDVTQSNGATVDTVLNEDYSGDILNATVTTTSADGLSKTIQNDIQGQSASVYAASGLSFDSTTTQTTTINADGSRVETTNVTSHNGTLVSTESQTTSANGLNIWTVRNPYATAHYATETLDTMAFNSDGSTTETVTSYAYDGAFTSQITTTTSASGLAETVLDDLNGDHTVDQSSTDLTTVNANGSRTEVVTDYTGETNGTVRDVTTTTSGIIVAGAGLETEITRQSDGSVPAYQVETIVPSANGTMTDTTQYYAHSGGALLLQTSVVTSANGLVKTTGTAVDGHTTNDFWMTDTTVLNANGSQTETVANSNAAGLISESVTTSYPNGLSTVTEEDANGAVNGSGAPVFNLTTTDNTVLNSNGSETETVTLTNANAATIEQTATTTSADQQTIMTNRYFNETGTITTVDQSETTQTQTNGSVTDTTTSYGTTHQSLGTIVKSTSGNGLVRSTTYNNASGTAVDTQTDTSTYDTNGDGGTLDDFEDSDIVNSITLKSSVKMQSTANGQSITTTTALSGALASTIAASFGVVTNDTTVIADSGVTTATVTDKINGATSANDTLTTVTSANGLSVTQSTTLGTSTSPYIVSQETTELDGTKTDSTAIYDPAALTTLLDETTTTTSYDGRTITTVTQDDYDQLNESVVGDSYNDPDDPSSYTPTYTGPQYDTETDTTVANADGTTTMTRSGTGSFDAPDYSQTINSFTNADASQTTLIENYDANGILSGQSAAETSADGLIEGLAFDTTGLETTANLETAVADIVAGSALPTSLLATDIIGKDAVTLNNTGTTTEVVETAYGDSFSNLRSETTTTTSANGLVVTTNIDNDGNGIFEQVDTSTTNPDGSNQKFYTYYGDTSSTSSTVEGTNTYTTSANGLMTTLTTSTGITDTTTYFPDSNGSYEFSRVVTSGSDAYYFGWSTGSASHDIDANGIDTWSWNDGYGDPATTISISVAVEQQDVAIANEIFQTLLGHPMDDSETQYSGQYIVNGVFDREQQAYDIAASSVEYYDNFGVQLNEGGSTDVVFQGFDVFAAFENALGRLPTAEEIATFGQYMTVKNPNGSEDNFDDLSTMAVALAQYATDLGGSDNRTDNDPNADLLSVYGEPLVATAPSWIAPGANAIQIGTAGTYSYSQNFIADLNSSSLQGVTATINGNDDVIVAYTASNLTVNGYNDAIDDTNATVTVSTSNASLMIEAGGNATLSGNDDQIGQIGPTKLTITSGTGNVIDISAGTLPSSPDYILPYATTDASNASITLGKGVGTTANPDLINGSSDVVTLTSEDTLTIAGSNNTINAGNGDSISVSGISIGSDTLNVTGSTISLGPNSNATLNGSNNTVVLNGGEYVEIGSGTGDVVNDDVSGDTVALAGNTSTTINGTGGFFGIVGGNVTVAASGDSVETLNGVSFDLTGNGDSIGLGSDVTANIYGNNNTLGLTGDDYAEIGSGTGNVVNNDVSGDIVALASNTSTTINGTGSYFGIVGSNVTVVASDASADALSGVSFNLTGNGNSIGLGSDVTANIYGNNNTLGLTGDDYAEIGSGTGNVVNNDVSGDIVALASNTSTTINGTGSYFGIVGSNVTVVASDASADALSGVSFNLTGNGNSIGLGVGSVGTVNGGNNTFMLYDNNTITATGTGENYNFASDGGQSEIASTSNSNTGTVNFGSGLNDENLWFQQVGNNLQIDVMGTTDHLTVDNWFGGSNSAAVQSFDAGGLKLDTQVNQLVSAMASYSANNPSFNPTTATEAPNNTSLQNTIASSWHS